MPGVAPSPRVWTRIAARLGMQDRAPPAVVAWWDRLGFWRRSLRPGSPRRWRSASRCTRSGPIFEAPIVVVLAGQDGKPALIASARRDDRFLLVKAVGAAPVDPGKTLELWMLPQGQPPRSLGVLPTGELVRVPLAAPTDAALANVPALAVSLEPTGGSPTGLPTGPVLYSGKIERMY